MRKENRRNFCAAACMLLAFLLWTAAVKCMDVRAIGPRGSTVGFAALNQFVHHLTGVHMALYTVTDWLGLVPIAFALGFAILGLVQWISRKSIRRVDRSILMLGGFYLAVLAAFLFFEEWVVNYRPVLIEGVLEASYPSSTTLLVLCVMSTAIFQLSFRMKKSTLRRFVLGMLSAFTVFMVMGRLVSGVHWFTDIAGGVLLSAGLVLLYVAFSESE